MLLEKLFLIILLSCIKASKVSNRFNNNERVKAGLQQPKVGGGTTIESISWGYTTESDPEDGSATFSYNFSHQISTSNISHGIPGKNNNRKFYTEGSDTYGFPKIPKVRQPLRVQRAKLIHPKRVKACPLGKALLKQKTRQSKAFDNDARRLVDFEDYEQDEMELESEDEKDEEEDQDDISFDKEDNSDSNSNGDGEDNELDNEKGQSGTMIGSVKVTKPKIFSIKRTRKSPKGLFY